MMALVHALAAHAVALGGAGECPEWVPRTLAHLLVPAVRPGWPDKEQQRCYGNKPTSDASN